MMINEKIKRLIDTDENFSKGFESMLKVRYKKADTKAQKTVDDIFVALCGYSLKSIIEGKADDMLGE